MAHAPPLQCGDIKTIVFQQRYIAVGDVHNGALLDPSHYCLYLMHPTSNIPVLISVYTTAGLLISVFLSTVILHTYMVQTLLPLPPSREKVDEYHANVDHRTVNDKYHS